MSGETPSPASDGPGAANAREEALLAAARARGRMSVLTRHADGAGLIALSTERTPRRVAECLLAGAVEEEHVSPARAAAHFVAAREREERGYAEEAVSVLPAMWLAVIGANPGEVRDALMWLGVDIAASVARPMSPAAAAEFLARLGGPLAGRAAEQRSRRDMPRPPAAMLVVWRAMFEEITARETGLAHACGLRVLGDLFRRLPAGHKTLAARVARTQIVRAMMEVAPLGAEVEGRLAAGIVAWLLAEARRTESEPA